MKINLINIFDPSKFLGSIFYAVVFLVVYLVLSRIIRKLTIKILLHQDRQPSEKPAIEFYSQLVQGGFFIVLLIIYFHLIPSIKSVGTAILATVSVISVVGGFAAQKTLGNLLAGLSLLIYKPFRLGDRIQVSAQGGVEIGVIKMIGLGYTILVSDDDRKIIIPNTVLFESVVVNLGQK